MYRILTEFKVFMYCKTRPVRIVTPSRAAARRYDSYGQVFPVHEHRKTRLVSDLHNEESNLVVKSFKFDAMQVNAVISQHGNISNTVVYVPM